MASAIIHLALAKELRKHLNISNEKDYYLGSIAPDLAKEIGISRDTTHFIINSPKDIPNIDIFTQKYNNFKMNSFNLGYFIHLYTDKLWFGTFLKNIISGNSITLLDGTIIEPTEEETRKLVYSDYLNTNIKVIEEFDLDLSLFYEEFKLPKTIIEEIQTEKLDIFIDKMGLIVKNSTNNNSYIFDIEKIKEFITTSKEEILKVLEKY